MQYSKPPLIRTHDFGVQTDLQSTTKVLSTPGSDSTKIRRQGSLGTIINGITRVGNPLPPNDIVNEQ